MAEGDAPVAKILRGLPANAGTLPLTPPGDGTEDGGSPDLGAVLDEEHVGDIEGAFGTIAYGDTGLRRSWKAKALTLLAIVGPGLIVMVGDNDAGGVATYAQAGQNFGTHLLWVLLFLIPVLYVAQEMVLRLGAVTGVGHARLILERFGKFWGAFSVIDLFVLNALTIVTEFIGVSLAAGYLGVPKVPAVVLAGVVIIVAASTGSLRRFERTALGLCIGSLIVIPLYLMVHPPAGQVARDFFVVNLPGGPSQLSNVMLLIIAIVGTTVAPWQLFFQQSYVIDKRITTRFVNYERVDLVIGIVIVVIGAGVLMASSAAVFAHTPLTGRFVDARQVAAGFGHYVSRAAGILFAIILFDASLIGASAIGLSTAYATADVLGLKHSLHRSFRRAKGFYAVFAGLMILSGALVLAPGVPLGTVTEGVQTLAGVLLPSATVFLLLLCNDREVLGPWANSTKTNVIASIIIGVLVLLSLILTAAVLFPNLSGPDIELIILVGAGLGVMIGVYLLVQSRLRHGVLTLEQTEAPRLADSSLRRANWRMPPLAMLERPVMSRQRKLGMVMLRGYLLFAFALVIVKVVEVAISK
ncbi:MAG: NRAMP family divalent metal transporter [Acidimicrobiales bacterium]|jgi:NRAMP (natural resistance-associated macrophage protein)-like metal ion transporter